MQRSKAFFVGVACGLVLGATLAVILAPDTGDPLREQTKQYLDEVKLKSLQAAEARRVALREELALKTRVPQSNTP